MLLCRAFLLPRIRWMLLKAHSRRLRSSAYRLLGVHGSLKYNTVGRITCFNTGLIYRELNGRLFVGHRSVASRFMTHHIRNSSLHLFFPIPSSENSNAPVRQTSPFLGTPFPKLLCRECASSDDITFNDAGARAHRESTFRRCWYHIIFIDASLNRF